MGRQDQPGQLISSTEKAVLLGAEQTLRCAPGAESSPLGERYGGRFLAPGWPKRAMSRLSPRVQQSRPAA